MIAEWKLREGEKWDKFTNKTKDGPNLSIGCKACLKFHVKGVCYSDCSHRRSHTILNDDDKRLVSRFVKDLREG